MVPRAAPAGHATGHVHDTGKTREGQQAGCLKAPDAMFAIDKPGLAILRQGGRRDGDQINRHEQCAGYVPQAGKLFWRAYIEEADLFLADECLGFRWGDVPDFWIRVHGSQVTLAGWTLEHWMLSARPEVRKVQALS